MEQLSSTPVITLITDFGLSDPYVGQLKGVLLGICRQARIIDISHEIPVWDAAAAAAMLHTSYGFFTPPAVHLTVVDPGVGGGRAILAATGGGHFFVAPDNGILSPLLDGGLIDRVCLVERDEFFRAKVSPTFHGRDIMAPVAAQLAQGRELESLGRKIPAGDIVQLPLPQPVLAGDSLQGQVLRIDHFGNICTNINEKTEGFDSFRFGGIEIAGHRIAHLSRTYAEARIGALLALIDSMGYLEIAVSRGSAADLLKVLPGDPVTVQLRRS